MRYCYLLILLGILSCKTNAVVTIDLDSTKAEVGKCYITTVVEKNGTKEKSFILEIIPPSFEDIEVIYSAEELEKFKIKDGRYKFETRVKHAKFVITNLPEYISQEHPIGYMYCIVEEPLHRLIISTEELAQNDNRITKKKLVSPSQIRKIYVKERPLDLKEHQYFFESGSWSEVKAFIPRDDHQGGYTVKDVQLKLIELGYDVTPYNIINQGTKDALLDFQRKNGLKEGVLSHETLELLGINY